MTSTLTLLRSNTVYSPQLKSYQLTLSVTVSQNITKTVFVKQRLRTTSNGINDVFVAIATPNQLESLGVGSPTPDTTFFLDSKITLIANTVEYLDNVLQDILSELQGLVTDVELIEIMEESAIYNISSGDIMINTYASHTHYRLPLFAAPCGTPVTQSDDTVIINDVNLLLQGWIPTTGSDPTGYFYKYNLATDPSFQFLFPPAPDKLAYAHVEKNGVTLDDGVVLINNNGIFWKNNNFGLTPWPSDYFSPLNPGGLSSATECILVFDFIV